MADTNAGQLNIGVKIDQGAVVAKLSALNRSVALSATGINRTMSGAFRGIGTMVATVGRGITTTMGRAFTTIERQAKRVGLVVGVALAGATAATIRLAMNAEETANLFKVSMGIMIDESRKFVKSFSESLGLNEYSVQKFMGTFNVMLRSMGVGAEEALKMSTELSKLTYDLASFYNLGVNEAFEKLSSGISGEIEPLKRLGIILSENAVQNYAFIKGIAEMGEELTDLQKIQARYGLLMQRTGIAQGDMERTADSATNVQRRLREQIARMAIDLGEKLLPLYNKFLQLSLRVVDVLKGPLSAWLDKITYKFNEWLNDPANIEKFKNALIGVKNAVVGIANALKPIIEFFAKNPSLLTALIGARIGHTLGGPVGAWAGGVAGAGMGDYALAKTGHNSGGVLAGVGGTAAAIAAWKFRHQLLGIPAKALGGAAGAGGATVGTVPTMTGFGGGAAGGGIFARFAAIVSKVEEVLLKLVSSIWGIITGPIGMITAAATAVYSALTLAVPKFAEWQGKQPLMHKFLDSGVGSFLAREGSGKRVKGTVRGGGTLSSGGKNWDALEARLAQQEAQKAAGTFVSKKEMHRRAAEQKRLQEEAARRQEEFEWQQAVAREEALKKEQEIAAAQLKALEDRKKKVKELEDEEEKLKDLQERMEKNYLSPRTLKHVDAWGTQRSFMASDLQGGFNRAARISNEERMIKELQIISAKLSNNAKEQERLANTYK